METGSPTYKVLVEILVLIHKKRKRILLMGMLIFLLSFILLKTCIEKYHSSVRFGLDESDPKAISTSEPERLILDQLASLAKYRMYYLLFSDEMATRLDRDCGLGIHYGLDKNSPEYFSDMISCMGNTIKLNKEVFNIITIEVTDNDKHYAAKIANAAFENLRDINRQTVLTNLRHKINIYDASINKFHAQNLNDLENLRKIFSDFEKEVSSKEFSNNDLMFVRSNLLNVLVESKNSLIALKKNELLNEITSDAMADSTIQSLYLLNKAYPEKEFRINFRFALYSLGISFIFSLHYLLMLYLFEYKKDYIKQLTFSLKYGELKN